MATYYRANEYRDKPIEKVEVLRASEGVVLILVRGQWVWKEVDRPYFNTWRKARNFLAKEAQERIDVAKEEVVRAKARLKEIIALTKEGV